MSYSPNTPSDREDMLRDIGSSVSDLFSSIPEGLKLKKSLDLPPPLSEVELSRKIGRLAGKNLGSHKYPVFMGGGYYDHFIPAAVSGICGRAEFYTSYTPYQPEASQGTLQAIFEYQSFISLLTGMEAVNASVYDGGSALAEGVLMALRINPRSRKVLVSASVHPEYLEVLKTYLAGYDCVIESVMQKEGRIDPFHLTKCLTADANCFVLSQPNFWGIIEEAEELTLAVKKKGVLVIAAADPISLALLTRL